MITRGTVGSTSPSDVLAPQGNCAMQFTVNLTNMVRYQAVSTHAKAVLDTQWYPVIYRIATSNTFRLMWNQQGFWNLDYGQTAMHGDFNGRDIVEAGIWTIIIVRKDLTGGSSQQKMIAIPPSGSIYRTGWFTQNDDGHQSIGLFNDYWGSGSGLTNMPVSAITVVDQLTLDEVDKIVTNANVDLSPIPMADNTTGEYGDVTTVALSAPSDLDASYTTIRYTLDGSEPTVASTLYTGPITVGSPFTPGTTVYLKCAYFSDTLGKSQTKTYTYTFKVMEPIPSFIPTGQSYKYFSRDVTIDWTKAPPTATEYWYTLDGTDPQTSGTAIKWVPGATYLFNSHPDPTIVAYGRQSALPNYLKVRAKYTTTSTWSAMSKTWTLYFQLTASGYPAVGLSGGYNRDLTISWDVFSAGGADPSTPVTTTVTVNGVETTHTEYSGSVVIPFGSVIEATYSIYGLSNDGLLRTYTKSGTASFGQYAPKVDKTAIISSGATANVQVTNPNPSSSVYYTVDGTDPSTSSSSSADSSFTVAIPNGSMLKAFAGRGVYKSPLVTAEVFREFEVGSTVTATREGSSYHYYSATQRVELNAPLGETTTSITVGSNVSSDTVTGTIDGASSSFFLWDTADQRGTVNAALTSLNVSDYRTRFWSRLSYVNVVAALSYGFNKTAWMTPGSGLNMTGEMTLFRISAVSKASSIVFDYVVDCTTYQATIKRHRTVHGSSAGTVTTTTAGILASGTTLNNTLTLTANSTYVSLSDGTGSSVENLTGDDAGATWFIEGVLNPEMTDIPAISTTGLTDTSMSMAASITTTAATGLLRRSPATVFSGTSAAFTSKSRTISFVDKESVVSQDIYVPCGPLKAHASVGYDTHSGAAIVDGPFEWKLPYVFDGSAGFDVSVDFNARFDRNPGQDITLYACTENYSGSATGIDIGTAFATLRCVVDVDANGTEIAGSAALELYAGSAATRIVAPTAQSRFKLRLVKEVGSSATTVYGYVGSTEVNLGTVTAPTTPIEFKLVRKGKAARPAPMHTLIFGASASGAIRTKTLTGTHLSSAFLMRKGIPVSIPATNITAPTNSVKAVFFNTTTNLITLEDLSFEPSDGRLLVGVLDTRNDQATWTGLLFSKTVRIRSDVAGTLGSGSILGAGDSLAVDEGRVSWLSSGYKQSLPVGTSDWVRPNVYVDLFRKKQIVRTFERQPIKLSLSVGPLSA